MFKLKIRKVISIILLLALLTCLLTSCAQTIEPATTKTEWAVLLMPDGSIVEGMCEYYGFSNGTGHVIIDGLKFCCDSWRIVVFEVEN